MPELDIEPEDVAPVVTKEDARNLILNGEITKQLEAKARKQKGGYHPITRKIHPGTKSAVISLLHQRSRM